ncbi:uncharacterized protein METZ01_LOCUS142276, partial [marine metagenome]
MKAFTRLFIVAALVSPAFHSLAGGF